MAAEIARGHMVKDVSADKCGWDITSQPPPGPDGAYPLARHIEVKGRARGETTICVTRNEIMYALNQGDKFVLAIVFVDGEAHEGPYYVRRPFSTEPDWATVSVNYEIGALLERAEPDAPVDNRRHTDECGEPCMTVQREKAGAEKHVPVRAPKKLIEVALPLDAINDACVQEKSIRQEECGYSERDDEEEDEEDAKEE